MVTVADQQPSKCDRYVVDVSIEFIDSPELTDAALAYDLWLVHRDTRGRQATDRLRITGSQGESQTYLFTPLYHAPNGTLVASERGGDGGVFRTSLYGSIKGRARQDGLVDLTFETGRSIGDSNGGTSSGGFKQLTVRHGETVEIELPAPTGMVRDFDLADGFAGQSTAIRITATRVR